jgi:hypothetical protein
MSAAAWAGPIDTTSSHVSGDDFQVDYAPAKEASLTVAAPAGVPVEIFEGQNRVAKGKTPLTFESRAAGIFIVALQPHGGNRWETPVAVRAGQVARLKATPGRGHVQPEAALRTGAVEEPLSALEFAALRRGLKGQAPGRRMSALDRLCGTARFTSRQADELVGWFATSDKVRVLKWVRSRMTESAATATSPAAGRPRA